MEIITIQKHMHTSPRKLRLVADMVRSMTPAQALTTLEFTPKAAAIPLSKSIKTSLANAKQQGLKEESLVFKSVEINEGMRRVYRMFSGGKGKRRPQMRRLSHIKIVLTDAKKEAKNGSKN